MKSNQVRSRSRIWKPASRFQSRTPSWRLRFKRNSATFAYTEEYESSRFHNLPSLLVGGRVRARLREFVEAAWSAGTGADCQYQGDPGSSEEQERRLPEAYPD